MKKLVLSLLLVLMLCSLALAQDTLPDFQVKNAGANRIVISWTNPFRSIRQISIQRSFDSLTAFKTILTVPDPTPPQNGYVDTRAPNGRLFYRIYILLEKGVYLFSASKRPVLDTLRQTSADPLRKTIDVTDHVDKIGGIDSIGNPNFGVNNKNKPNVFTPSLHVYTYKDGFVRVNLPDDQEKKYTLKFFEADDSFLFELKDIRTRTFRVDKANFYHAGWFRFELYENGKLIEKHKFYLEKEF